MLMLECLGCVMDLLLVKVYVYEILQVNGFVVFDGCIFLIWGFLDCLDVNDVIEVEFVLVIVYELGYVVYGYFCRWMVDFVGQNVICMVLVGVFGCFLFGIGGWIVNFVVVVVVVCLLWQDEFEVDVFVSVLMVKVGFGIKL